MERSLRKERRIKVGEPNWKNRTLFHADNLDFLRAMNSESVDLIATDPPFKKGRDFHATPNALKNTGGGGSFQDRWHWDKDVQPEWLDQIKDDFPKVMTVIEGSRKIYGDDMGAYLCFMAVRLLEMERILKPTGSIYIHCDLTANSYLRFLMDAIFGKNNFRNEIVWCYGKMSNTTRNFPRNHDTILRYTKTDNFTFTPIKGAESEYRTRFQRYLTGNCVLFGTVKHSRDKLILRRINKISKKLGRELQDSDILFDFNKEFKVQSDVLYVSIIKGNASERQGYPTQKPLALYEKIITASSDKNDIVLDPFAGCATTCVAAERLGRKWIGIDLWEGARSTVLERMKKETGGGTLFPHKIYYKTKKPTRTDNGAEAVPFLSPINTRVIPLESWQKLSRAEMTEELAEAQSLVEGLVVCAGCGREMELPFMELDHINPRSSGGVNDISNRILLCRPCNGKKSNQLALPGLRTKNRREKWMKDKGKADWAGKAAQDRYEKIRYG